MLESKVTSGVARNLIWGGGIRFNYSHCNFKTCVNVPRVNKTVTDFFFGGVYIPICPPVATPLKVTRNYNSGAIGYTQADNPFSLNNVVYDSVYHV